MLTDYGRWLAQQIQRDAEKWYKNQAASCSDGLIIEGEFEVVKEQKQLESKHER